jgi:hypothetical protein
VLVYEEALVEEYQSSEELSAGRVRAKVRVGAALGVAEVFQPSLAETTAAEARTARV